MKFQTKNFTKRAMLHDPPQASGTLGADLRALRKARGLTLAQMAESLGRSVGVAEPGGAGPVQPLDQRSAGDGGDADISVSSLFRSDAPADEAGLIVRAGARRPIGNRVAGLVEELLSPDLTDDFEVVHSTFEPHSDIGETCRRRRRRWAMSSRAGWSCGSTGGRSAWTRRQFPHPRRAVPLVEPP